MNKKIKNVILVFIYLLVYYFILYLLNTTCPIKWLTGISCAGCGMSRAYLALLKGDITLAFYYHPLFWTLPIVLIIYLKRKMFPKKVLICLLSLLIILFMSVYLIRMFDPGDDIVVFNLKDSIIYKILSVVRG